MIRRSFFGLLLIVLATPLSAQTRVAIKHAVAKDVSVRVSGAFQSLKVIAWEQDSILLTGTRAPGAKVEAYYGSPDAAPRGLKIYAEAPSATSTASTVLELRVPSTATVWAKAGSAVIDVQGMRGGLDLNIVGGSVTVVGDPRELNIESMDGRVSVQGSPPWVRIKTATGDIDVTGSSVDAAFVTVGGALSLRGERYERVRVESVTGAVAVAGTIAKAGSLTIDAHSGPVTLQVGQRPSLDIEASTVLGSIVNEVTNRRPTPGREGRGEELTLNLGTGDARATLRTFKGTIRLVR